MASKTGSLLYAQLSQQQRVVLSKQPGDVVLADEFGSFTGPSENLEYFRDALSVLKVASEGLACSAHLAYAYVRIMNRPDVNSKLLYGTFVSQLKSGFIRFVGETDRKGISVNQIERRLLEEFIAWLKHPKRKIGANTARRYYAVLKDTLETLQENGTLLNEELSFPNLPFLLSDSTSRRTERLDDVTFGQLMHACMTEIDVTLGTLKSAWEFFDSNETVEPDNNRRGPKRYGDIRSVWTWIRRQYGDKMVLPSMADICLLDKDVSEAVKNHGFFVVTLPFYPNPEAIYPFIMLQAIYTFANAAPLYSLQESSVKPQEVMGVSRVVVDLYKERSDTYQRSFATDPADRFSPDELFKVIKRWTSNIRDFAGHHSGHAFLFVTKERRVRGFLTGAYDGLSSDSSWNSASKKFREKYRLPKITLRVVRTTGLDITREVHDDDIMAVAAVAGTKGATLESHYEGGAAKARRQENLLPVMVAYERWASLGGKSDTRRAPFGTDMLAATPGWNCFDSFASPIAGEIHGRACQAFGRCPGCELGFVDLQSPYALARAVQLTDELKAARFYLEHQRWKFAFEKPLRYLEKKWLPAFSSPAVVEAAKRLTLPPIGKVE